MAILGQNYVGYIQLNYEHIRPKGFAPNLYF